jgi:hypothetical protein
MRSRSTDLHVHPPLSIALRVELLAHADRKVDVRVQLPKRVRDVGSVHQDGEEPVAIDVRVR